MKNISKYIYCAIFVLGLFTSLFSCNKDLGNYDYVSISTVDSIKIQEKIRLPIGGMLRVSPELFLGGNKDKNDFNYTWYYREGGNAVDKGEWIVLHEGPEIEMEVADPIGTLAKTYKLAFEMVNKTTGVTYRKLFELIVENPYARGFAALCELEDGFDIDMIALSPDDKLVKYERILEMSDSEIPRQGVKPRDILTYKDRSALNPFAVNSDYSLFILTDQYSSRLKISDYSWESSYDISNIVEPGSHLDKEYKKQGKPIIASKIVGASSDGAARVYMYHKEPDGTGNWYFYTDYQGLVFLSVQMNGVRSTDPATNGQRFEPAPFVASLKNGTMFFDADNNRFLYSTIGSNVNTFYASRIYYSEPIVNEPDGVLFKFNDPNNESLLYMGTTWDVERRAYAIIKLADGTFKYIEFGNAANVGAWSTTTAARHRVSIIPATSGIANAKFIARPGNAATNPFLYYVTNDNRVMKMDVSAATAVESDITSQIITEEGYGEITLFEFTLPESSTMPDAGKSAREALAVGTFNSSLGMNDGGKLEFFTPVSTTTGNMTLAKYPDAPAQGSGYQIDMKWTGMGRIVGLTYKEK